MCDLLSFFLLLQIHKYIIQAQVLRDSWPLSKSAWEFVAMLKNLDRLDVEGKRLPSNYALLLPNNRAKSRLRGIKQKKIQFIPLNIDLDLLFRISEA